MFRKILVGLAAVALVCMLAMAGYRLGHALAQSDQHPPAAAD